MITFRYHWSEAGDTIVEVLIAITMVSLVLAAAYTTTRQSRNAIRSAQEHGEALKYAEAQVEQIKIALSDGTTLPASFCFASDGTITNLPNVACTVSALLYQQSVIKTSGVNYVVQVQWDGLAGRKNQVELDYKAQ